MLIRAKRDTLPRVLVARGSGAVDRSLVVPSRPAPQYLPDGDRRGRGLTERSTE